MAAEMSFRPAGKIQRATTFVVVCLGLFLFVVLVTVLVMSIYPSADQKTHHRVAQFSGKDNGQTGPFTVQDHWEFRWQHNGHFERIIWRRADGAEELLMEMPGKPIREQGSVNYFPGGEYTLEMVGQGDWKLEVYQF